MDLTADSDEEPQEEEEEEQEQEEQGRPKRQRTNCWPSGQPKTMSTSRSAPPPSESNGGFM